MKRLAVAALAVLPFLSSRVSAEDGLPDLFCSSEGDKSVACGGQAKKGRAELCCPGLICGGEKDKYCVPPPRTCGLKGERAIKCGAAKKGDAPETCCPGFKCERGKKNVRCVSINDLDLTEEPEPTPSLPAETKKPQKEKEVNGAFRTELTVEVKGPTDVQISPDGSLMMVAQKDGDVSIVEDYESSNPQVSKAVTLTQICTNVERGISGAAFHPFFGSDNRYIYLYYTFDKYKDCDASGDPTRGPINRLSRFVLDKNNKVDKNSEEVLINTPILPYGSHNSGNIAFGNDGYLYITIGDGGGGISKKNADGILYPQALDMLLGKLIRITDDGEIPPSNPYVDANSARCSKNGWSGKAKLKCQEIFSYGLRNPFRFSIDPNTEGKRTRIFINDVGRQTWESIREGGDDFKGANYGYPEREGPCKKKEDKGCKRDERFVDPIHWFHHDDEEGGAVTGGVFYPNDLGWPLSFKNSYFYADYANGGLFSMTPGGKGCTYDEGCDPPISPYDETLDVFSDMQKVVALKFGPYAPAFGGKAMYAATRGHTKGAKGKQGIFRIWYDAPKFGSDAVSGPVRLPPKAVANADAIIGFPPMTVNFNGMGSYDPNVVDQVASDGSYSSSGLQYKWDFGSGGDSQAYTSKASYRYEQAGIYYAQLTVIDSDGKKDSTEIKIVVENIPPRLKIIEPAEDTTFSVGDVLKLRGSATSFDEKKRISDDNLLWEVRLHHRDHFHTMLEPTRGNKIELPPAPEPSNFATAQESYLVVLLTARDENGLSATTETIIRPKLVEFTLNTNPSGMMLMANSETFKTPITLSTWNKNKVKIGTEQTQSNGVEKFEFEKWSDGYLERNRTFVAKVGKKEESTMVANYLGGLRIDAPIDGSTFAVGDKLRLSGTSTDGLLDESAFSWEVKMLSDTQSFTLLEPTTGNDIEVRCPDPLSFEFAEVAIVNVTLTMTESDGKRSSRSSILYPKVVKLAFDTKPSGLTLDINGDLYKTPKTIATWENHSFQVKAPSQRLPNSAGDGFVAYLWESWSDGGNQQHAFVTPTGDRQEIIASFQDLAMGEDMGTALTIKAVKTEKKMYVGEDLGVKTSIVMMAVAFFACLLIWVAKNDNFVSIGGMRSALRASNPPDEGERRGGSEEDMLFTPICAGVLTDPSEIHATGDMDQAEQGQVVLLTDPSENHATSDMDQAEDGQAVVNATGDMDQAEEGQAVVLTDPSEIHATGDMDQAEQGQVVLLTDPSENHATSDMDQAEDGQAVVNATGDMDQAEEGQAVVLTDPSEIHATGDMDQTEEGYEAIDS